MHVSELLLFSCSFLVSFEKGQCSVSWQQTLFDQGKLKGSESNIMGKGLHIVMVKDSMLFCGSLMAFLSEVFKGKLLCGKGNKIPSDGSLQVPLVPPLL